MEAEEFTELETRVRAALRKYSKGRLAQEDIEDEALEILRPLLAGTVKHVPTYIDRAAKNRVINFLNDSKRKEAVSLEEVAEPVAESPEEDFEEARESELKAAKTPELQFIEQKYPQEYAQVRKAVDYVTFLYCLKVTRPGWAWDFIPVSKTINALLGAKDMIDGWRIDTIEPGVGLTAARAQVRDGEFYWRYGERLSGFLGDEIEKLELERRGPWGSSRFSNFVLDSIPKLRADPIMLLLKVLYKIFRVGSGKHGTHDKIKQIILELKREQDEAPIQEIDRQLIEALGSVGPSFDLFGSVSADTNFETLRRKTYRKGSGLLYERLAEEIFEACQDS